MENHNSTKNQEIKGKFVDQHVYACVTTLMDYVLLRSCTDNDAPLTFEDLSDSLYYEDQQGQTYTELEREVQLAEWQEEKIGLEDQSRDHLVNPEGLNARLKELDQLIDTLEDATEQYTEIFEWWIVTSYLAGKLENKSQTILRDGLNNYWGRCTTGQSILLDNVISEICYSMGIMEGQQNAWLK